MATTPLVSVIIPAYNGEQFIGEAIESALAQRGVAIEVIVVDDGSSDQTVERIVEFGERVRLFQKKNGGVASARNFGIARARGRFVALLDQDDRYLPGKLATQIDMMNNCPEAVVCHGNIRMIDALGHALHNGHLGHPTDESMPSGMVLERLFQWNFILACTALMQRDAVLAVGGFNERLWGVDDYELWMKLATLGPIIYANEIISEYRWHGENASRNEFRMALGRLLAREEFLREIPAAWSLLGSKKVRKIIAKYSSDFGYSFYKSGCSAEARIILLKGLRYAPFTFILWRMYFASHLHFLIIRVKKLHTKLYGVRSLLRRKSSGS